MNTTILVVLFYLLLIDSVFANIAAWSGIRHWYVTHMRTFAKYFPLSRAWTGSYLILVLFIGYIIHTFITPLI